MSPGLDGGHPVGNTLLKSLSQLFIITDDTDLCGDTDHVIELSTMTYYD